MAHQNNQQIFTLPGRWAAVAAFVVAFVFFQFFYPYHLVRREQMTLFVFDWDYVLQTYRGDGWLARLVSDFLEQFFHLPVVGPLVVEEKKQKSKTEKTVNVRSGLPSDYLQEVAAAMEKDENRQGYEGSVTCFLEPAFEKSMVADIDDPKFPERNGRYFVETVEGEYSASGGRQKLTLRQYDN